MTANTVAGPENKIDSDFLKKFTLKYKNKIDFDFNQNLFFLFRF